jgi:hypothetical protein
MRFFGFILAVTLFVPGGCTTKSAARQRAQKAYLVGRQSAMKSQQIVSVLGEVRNPTVIWTEGLTLAKAVVLAEFTGTQDPGTISVTRKGERVQFTGRQLLNGEEGPLLQPGDLIEIRR